MLDLSNSIFYKIKFNISNLNSDDDIVQKIVDHIHFWLSRKWNRKQKNIPDDDSTWNAMKNGSTLRSFDKKSVFMESVAFYENTDMPFWACRISENRPPKAEYAPREWITEIGIESLHKGSIAFSCVISFVDRPGFIGKCENEPTPNVPNLIKKILEDKSLSCTYGCDTVKIDPINLSAGMWLPFWERSLDKKRAVPYIYISQKYDQEAGKMIYLVDPYKLATAAGGNALVFYEEDLGVIDEMNYCCPQEYKCYGGAIRVYFPNLAPDDPLDAHRHRYISANTIKDFGAESIVRMIRRALAQDVHFYESFFRVDDCRRKQEGFNRQQRLRELTQKHEAEKKLIKREKEEEADKYFALAEEEEEKRIQTEDLLSDTRVMLQRLKEENFNLSSEIEGYRSLAAKNAELERVCNNRLSTKQYPESPQSIVNYFDATFGDRIAFSDDAYKSLKYCEIPLGDIWKTLFALATCMYELQKDGSGDIYSQFKQETGIDISRGEGTMTRKDSKLMRQFTTEYHNQSINIEPHITFPRIGQSIHFGYSERDEKIIIGSCGEHKEIYSSQKRK